MKINLFDVEEVTGYADTSYRYQISMLGTKLGEIECDDSFYEHEIQDMFLKNLCEAAMKATAKDMNGVVGCG